MQVFRFLSVVVSRPGLVLAKSVLPKCSCEFIAIRYFLGFVFCFVFNYYYF